MDGGKEERQAEAESDLAAPGFPHHRLKLGSKDEAKHPIIIYFRSFIYFPISVFADSPEKGVTMRKSQSGSLKEVVASVKQDETVPDSWDDDVLEDKDPEERVLKIRDPVATTKLWQPRRNKENYLRLPIDFWHMLASYIPPHEIGLFACICRAAHSVTWPQSFWRRLYLRICHDARTQDQLPQRLSTSTLLHRPRGLRACVIRALHIAHQPFVLAARAPGWPDPQRLIGATCMLHWTKRSAQKQVTFFFKLRDAAVEGKEVRRGRAEEKEDWLKEHGEDVDEEGREESFLEEMSDIGHNPEEGCRVMQVGSAAWSKVPPVMGLQLRSVGLSVSGLGMRWEKP